MVCWHLCFYPSLCYKRSLLKTSVGAVQPDGITINDENQPVTSPPDNRIKVGRFQVGLFSAGHYFELQHDSYDWQTRSQMDLLYT